MSFDSSMIIAYFLPLKLLIKSGFMTGKIMFFIKHVHLSFVHLDIFQSAIFFMFNHDFSKMVNGANSTVTGYTYSNLNFSHFQCISFAALSLDMFVLLVELSSYVFQFFHDSSSYCALV